MARHKFGVSSTLVLFTFEFMPITLSLWAANRHMLAEKVAQRSAESGEHYITRDGVEYRRVLGKALGGGAVIGRTTWAKFAIVGLALSPF
jgi:site-specific recombinase